MHCIQMNTAREIAFYQYINYSKSRIRCIVVTGDFLNFAISKAYEFRQPKGEIKKTRAEARAKSNREEPHHNPGAARGTRYQKQSGMDALLMRESVINVTVTRQVCIHRFR